MSRKRKRRRIVRRLRFRLVLSRGAVHGYADGSFPGRAEHFEEKGFVL